MHGAIKSSKTLIYTAVIGKYIIIIIQSLKLNWNINNVIYHLTTLQLMLRQIPRILWAQNLINSQ